MPTEMARLLLSASNERRLNRASRGEAYEDRDTGPDLEFVFPGDRGGRARAVQAGGPRRRSRARRAGGERACRAQGRQPRVSRLLVASRRRRISGMAWREAPPRAITGDVLV